MLLLLEGAAATGHRITADGRETIEKRKKKEEQGYAMEKEGQPSLYIHDSHTQPTPPL